MCVFLRLLKNIFISYRSTFCLRHSVLCVCRSLYRPYIFYVIRSTFFFWTDRTYTFLIGVPIIFVFECIKYTTTTSPHHTASYHRPQFPSFHTRQCIPSQIHLENHRFSVTHHAPPYLTIPYRSILSLTAPYHLYEPEGDV